VILTQIHMYSYLHMLKNNLNIGVRVKLEIFDAEN
jgi:hypothetical protein